MRGVPSIINQDQWDVSELTDEDFAVITRLESTNTNDAITTSTASSDTKGMRFRYLVSLSLILSAIYDAF